MADKEILWTRSKDVITIIILPFALWVVSSINSLNQSIIRLDINSNEISEIKSQVKNLGATDANFKVQVARLETKLEGISSDLTEIKTILEELRRRDR